MKNLDQLDLFPIQMRQCAHCGDAFTLSVVGRERGRPEAFCGERCRQARAKAQRAAWGRQNRKSKRMRSSPAGSA